MFLKCLHFITRIVRWNRCLSFLALRKNSDNYKRFAQKTKKRGLFSFRGIENQLQGVKIFYSFPDVYNVQRTDLLTCRVVVNTHN